MIVQEIRATTILANLALSGDEHVELNYLYCWSNVLFWPTPCHEISIHGASMVHGPFSIDSLSVANLYGETREFHDMNRARLCQVILKSERPFQVFSLL